MAEITGTDIDRIEELCTQLREGHTEESTFRKEIVILLGYSPEILQNEQELFNIKELW